MVVSMKDRRVLRRDPGGAVEEVADIGAWCGGHANDMVVDAAGRAYVGNFGFDLMDSGAPQTTGLVRIDPGGAVTLAAEGLGFPNGMVIAPDGATLVVAETFGARLTAFTVDADGALSERRVWARLAATPAEGVTSAPEIAPDGCTLDAEGHIWAADAIGGRAIRVAPGGGIVDEIHPPGGLGVFACMLGGDDGDTLLLCAAPDFLEHRRAPARDAVLLTTRVDAPHAGLP
jgi:sugar lactone lactonase YvrE